MIGLADLGWNVKILPTEEHIPEHLPEKERLLELKKNKLPDDEDAITISIVPATSHFFRARYNILYCTIETVLAHKGLVRRCLLFDEVWVPSTQNKKALTRAGLSRKLIHVMPEGADVHLQNLMGPKLPKLESKKYTFLFIGDWSYRKGVKFLVEAYLDAFRPDDNVRLLLLTHYQGRSREKGEENIIGEFQDILRDNGSKSQPEIRFILDYVPEPDMPKLYRTANCYVLPTLGEAWSLTVIQAMAHGLPVITTKYGGHMDYCRRSNSYLVKVDKFDTIDDKTNLHVDFYKEQLFAFPNIKHLSKVLKFVYNNQEQAKVTGLIAQQDIIKYWTWDQAVQKIHERLKKIEEGL
jgi:glycosyltransferase involved in cell wall biosynthesis